MAKDDDYIYSYIDKKMVKANDKHKFEIKSIDTDIFNGYLDQ